LSTLFSESPNLRLLAVWETKFRAHIKEVKLQFLCFNI
jgi:hypothetical protein